MKKLMTLIVCIALLSSLANAQIQLFDDFDNGALDAGLWNPTGTVTESGTIAAIDPASQFRSIVTT